MSLCIDTKAEHFLLAEPAEPAEQEELTEPAEPAEPAEPTEPAEPAEPAHLANPAMGNCLGGGWWMVGGPQLCWCQPKLMVYKLELK